MDTNINHALELEWDGFEDSVQFTVGEALSADFIVTRNTQDFASGSIFSRAKTLLKTEQRITF
jgi:hypothetical protein